MADELDLLTQFLAFRCNSRSAPTIELFLTSVVRAKGWIEIAKRVLQRLCCKQQIVIWQCSLSYSPLWASLPVTGRCKISYILHLPPTVKLPYLKCARTRFFQSSFHDSNTVDFIGDRSTPHFFLQFLRMKTWQAC